MGFGALYGDSRKLLPTLDTGSVQQVVTSPPYFGQRVYGDNPEEEIGWGSLGEYIAQLGVVLGELHRVCDTDATVWFVIGDKRAGSGGAGGDHTKTGKTPGSKVWIPSYGKANYEGFASGQAMMVPFHFAAAAQAGGWLVRSIIVWDKSPNVKPEDPKHANRPLFAHEIIVMLAKHPKHRWHADRLAEKGDVWHVKPHRSPTAVRHYAPFPPELPERAILAASSRGDLVLDPFAGSMTTPRVASQLGRKGLGIELYRPGEPAEVPA